MVSNTFSLCYIAFWVNGFIGTMEQRGSNGGHSTQDTAERRRTDGRADGRTDA